MKSKQLKTDVEKHVYHCGPCTSAELQLVLRRSEAGIRKTLNALVKEGTIKKVDRRRRGQNGALYEHSKKDHLS